MQTSFTKDFLKTEDGQRVDSILRKCVHCGFCNATCPTYQLTGNELDGPRGRIYLIKNFFENTSEQIENKVGLKHLDRCLTCLSCETTCPSGVQYGELVDIGRKHITSSVARPSKNKLKRKLILFAFSNPSRVKIIMAIARFAKPFLPTELARKIPTKNQIEIPINQPYSHDSHEKKKLLMIKGCVQRSLAPQINQATKVVLEKSNFHLEESNSQCCGAMAFHLTELDQAEKTIRANIDNWYEKLKKDTSKIIVNSSGCSSFIKQYSTIMQTDSLYAEKAKYISEHCIDLSETIPSITSPKPNQKEITVAFHNPCTLQHGQKIKGDIEQKLIEAGYKLTEVKDAHLCCGSAGTYSLLEKNLSNELLTNKLNELEKNQPDVIATANIGCLLHLQSGTNIPVKHWIELLN